MRETERTRLVELIAKSGLVLVYGGIHPDTHKCQEALADYLLDNGIVVPPVKVGDVVYKPWKAGGRSVVAEFVVVAIISAIRDDWCIKYKKVGGTICYQAVISDIGKTVFTSREDAEKALRKEDEGK